MTTATKTKTAKKSTGAAIAAAFVQEQSQLTETVKVSPPQEVETPQQGLFKYHNELLKAVQASEAGASKWATLAQMMQADGFDPSEKENRPAVLNSIGQGLACPERQRVFLADKKTAKDFTDEEKALRVKAQNVVNVYYARLITEFEKVAIGAKPSDKTPEQRLRAAIETARKRAESLAESTTFDVVEASALLQRLEVLLRQAKPLEIAPI